MQSVLDVIREDTDDKFETVYRGVCPTCGSLLVKDAKGDDLDGGFCPYCGKELSWEDDSEEDDNYLEEEEEIKAHWRSHEEYGKYDMQDYDWLHRHDD